MPDVNDYIMQTITLHAGPGHTINDGLLAYFIQGGAVGKTTLQDAERRWLEIRSTLDTIQDMWMDYLTTSGFAPGGTLNDKKLAFWSTLPAP